MLPNFTNIGNVQILQISCDMRITMIPLYCLPATLLIEFPFLWSKRKDHIWRRKHCHMVWCLTFIHLTILFLHFSDILASVFQTSDPLKTWFWGQILKISHKSRRNCDFEQVNKDMIVLARKTPKMMQLVQEKQKTNRIFEVGKSDRESRKR